MYDGKIIDSHFHVFGGSRSEKFMLELIRKSGISAIAVASIPNMLAHGEYFCNKEGLSLKRKHPGKIFYFAGLDYSDKSYLKGEVDFAEQAKMLFDSGADGIKMLEGKPNARKALGVPLDSEIFDTYYSYMEKESLPILMHVADPEEFWDPKKVSDWAKKSGWFWGDGTFCSKEQLYKETENVLKKFPKLKIIFAHFYFMSADIARASEFLDKWRNVSFDITPGIEMYHNFTRRPGEWREFFTRHNDRIIFGTDNHPPGDTKNTEQLDICVGNIAMIRDFLETDKKMLSGRGLKLGSDTLEKIYCGNFMNRISMPRQS